MPKSSNNVLILAPHTDDGEFGCGGTLARLLEDGKNLIYVAFSTCKDSIPKGFPKNTLRIELGKAIEALGIPNTNLIVLDYPVREFLSYRQNILEDLVRFQRDYSPEIVFAPSENDIHQDHSVIAVEAKRTFKKTTLLAYEVTWNNYTFFNQAYYKLEERHLRKKIEALKCYESQKMRDYAQEDFLIGQARVHGVQIGCEYAEVFEVVREIK